MARFSDEELAMLTEDERRAIEELGEEYDEDNDQPPMDPDDDPEEFEGAEEESDEADADPDDDAADPDDEAAEEEPAEEEQAADDGADDDAPKDEGQDGDADADKAVEPEQQAPLLDAQMPEGYEDRIKELEGKRETLDVDFDDGELTSQEYRQQLREIENEERSLREQAFEANLAYKMHLKQQEQAWHATANAWLDRNNLYRQSDMLYDTLNRHVKDIANSEEAAGMTGEDILAAAHKRVTSDPVLARVFEDGNPKEDAGDGGKGKQDGKGKDGKRLERRNVPPTLANVPASDMTGAEEGGAFAKLDKMDGLALEDELSRLERTNPAAYQQYMER